MRTPLQRFALILFTVALVPVTCFADPIIAGYGSVKLDWKVLPILKLSVTPNYTSGYGPSGGVGSGSTPAPGPGASLGGGIVDFGSNVVQGYDYLYKYALEANVQTNDLSGFTVYAEGTSNINDESGGSPAQIPINQTLFWLDSTSANTAFSSGTPFSATVSPVSAGCGGQCINYVGNPPPSAQIWDYPNTTFGKTNNTVSQGFDYQLRLDNYPNTDSFSVYITYTAVAN